MVFLEFITFLEKLMKTRCKDIYYSLPDEWLSEGLGVIQIKEITKSSLRLVWKPKKIKDSLCTLIGIMNPYFSKY